MSKIISNYFVFQQFQVTYKIIQSTPIYSNRGALPNIDDYPVLNATATDIFSAQFLNDCGSEGICYSDLVLTPKLNLPKGAVFLIHDTFLEYNTYLK